MPRPASAAFRFAILLVGSLFLLASNAHGLVGWHDEFEAPLAPGPLAKAKHEPSRDPHWAFLMVGGEVDASRLVQVQTAVVRGGTQALAVDAQAAGAFQSGISTKLDNSEPYVRIEFDFFLQRSPQPTVWQIGVGDDQAKGGFVGGVNIAQDNGRLQFMTKGFPETGPIVTRGVWTHCALAFDLRAQTYEVALNGRLVRAKIPFLTDTRKVTVFQFDTFAHGNDRAYFDNFAFDAGPSLAALPATGAPGPVPVPAPAVVSATATPAPSGPLSLTLSKNWAAPTALSVGGHSQEIGDLRELLSPHGQPSEELKAPANQRLLEGITYLQPLAAAVAQLVPAHSLALKTKIACGGFPDGLSVSTYTGRWGAYNRLCFVSDMADQVVALEFVCETASFVPVNFQTVPPLPGNWHLIDIVEAQVKGAKGIVIDMRLLDSGQSLAINSTSRQLHHTATWYVGKPLVNVILRCAELQGGR